MASRLTRLACSESKDSKKPMYCSLIWQCNQLSLSGLRILEWRLSVAQKNLQRTGSPIECADVRYWHKADIPSCTAHVR